jgi:hypothetical protein
MSNEFYALGQSLKPLRDIAGSEYADLIDELSDADRQWVIAALASRETPRVIFATIHARWLHRYSTEQLPSLNPSLSWWRSRVIEAPLAHGLSFKQDGIVELGWY